jgi:hypothetical protein
MPNKKYSFFMFFILFYFLHKSNKNNKDNRQNRLPHPQTKMTHCPKCDQKYNTEKATQVGCNIGERPV